MQLVLLNWLSTWEFLLYMTTLITTMSTLIFLLVKQFVPASLHKQNKKLFTLSISIVIANYGFILGFIIINLWQSLLRANTLVAVEGAQLSLMVFDCFALPADIQNKLLNAIGQYIKYVVQDEWETMRWGNASSLAENAMANIFHLVQSYSPQSEIEKSFYHELISHLRGAFENRHLRLQGMNSILIPPLRFILILGVILISFFVSLLEIKNKLLHWAILMVVSFVIAFNISLALMIDYPFSGEISVSTKPFEEGVLARFKDEPLK
jgi:hypothetical protein